MNAIEEYLKARDEQVKHNQNDPLIHGDVNVFMDTIHRTNYVKNFTWMGIPIMQLPEDLMAMQEIIWKVKPDYIIETGVAFGGMTVFYSSILRETGEVICIDIDLRPYAYDNIEHARVIPICMSSIDEDTIRKVKYTIRNSRRILVSLDSNHTHAHVLQELRLYAPLVSVGSYIVVFDTSIEWLDPKYIPEGRPWGKGNNPWTAVQEFMQGNDEFVVDTDIENRILLTSAPGGWLKRIK